ncbi:MAG TPA: indole-3-glycerol phosphate synthase TrpC [Phycisphaerae bacterium]|nr:indole-3-glycerol phosphate synthase TrpC [Phycisphaerae bacterium]
MSNLPPGTPDILQQIVQTKKEEVAAAKARTTLEELKARCANQEAPRNFFAALTREPQGLVNIIAEVKKASPSAGTIKADFDPVAQARTYHAAGADALSVLTDEQYFHGHLDYIAAVKNAVPLPVLRKDFIIDPYQVYESRAAGADAILLIAEILTDSMMIDLQILATELKLTTLVEVHEMDSLLRVNSTMSFPHASYYLLGINNRDLRTFSVDLQNTVRLADFVENKKILVSESGIKDKADVQRMAAAGVRTLLIGETLMKSPDVGGTLANLKGTFRKS